MKTTDTSYTPPVKTKPDTKYLRDIAVFLTGYKKAGSLNDLALGDYNLRVLWEAIEFINKSEPR